MIYEFTNKYYEISIMLITLCLVTMALHIIFAIKNRYKLRDLTFTKPEFKEADPYTFEELVAELFERHGYKLIKVTKKAKDIGVDILLKKKGRTYVVQVKKYAEDNKISRPDLQRLQGAAQHYNAQGMIFVTYGFFTKDSIQYAREHGIELIDHYELMSML